MSKTICPSCGDIGDHKELPYGGYFYNGISMPLVSCGVCGLTFIKHNLTLNEINSFYDVDEYFSSEYAGGGATVEYESNKDDQEKKARVALDVISKYKRGGHLLEIGCAGGYLLKLAKDKYNFDPKGVEISKRMSDFGNKKLGLDIHCGTVESMPTEWRNFDVVYMGDVLEHIPEPISFMNLVKSKMKEEGIICLELPFTYNFTLSGLVIALVNFFRLRIGRLYFLPAQHRTNFVKKPPYHLLMFTKRSIKYFLEHNGFLVKYIKIYEGKPKFKFGESGIYVTIKNISYYLTFFLPQSILGDRIIVVAEKNRK